MTRASEQVAEILEEGAAHAISQTELARLVRDPIDQGDGAVAVLCSKTETFAASDETKKPSR